MKRTLTIGILFVLLLTYVGAVSANLVQNPSFESPQITGALTTCPSGTCPVSWTVQTGNINLIRTYWSNSDGSQSIDLTGEPYSISPPSRGSISQQIPTTTNGPYELTFDMAGNFNCGPQNFRNVSVYWGGNFIGTHSFVIPQGWSNANMGWTQISFNLPAPLGSSTELKFVDVTAGLDNCGVALDNINVISSGQPISTPEFPTVALPAALIVGMLGAVLFIQRTREH